MPILGFVSSADAPRQGLVQYLKAMDEIIPVVMKESEYVDFLRQAV